MRVTSSRPRLVFRYICFHEKLSTKEFNYLSTLRTGRMFFCDRLQNTDFLSFFPLLWWDNKTFFPVNFLLSFQMRSHAQLFITCKYYDRFLYTISQIPVCHHNFAHPRSNPLTHPPLCIAIHQPLKATFCLPVIYHPPITRTNCRVATFFPSFALWLIFPNTKKTVMS